MSKRIYLDNAATTALDKEVLDAMLPYMTEQFGNPSSIYSYGREARIAIENSRKSVANIFNVRPGTIIFTSGGTESNNTAIAASIRDLGCDHIITSAIEHHAVLHSAEAFAHHYNISKSFVTLTEDGRVDYDNLERQLAQQERQLKKCLVTLMHANNEIGTLTDIKIVGELCRKYKAIFHSDCVQTVGHYPINLSRIYIHFISGSGHKFHGPKGTGILYVNENMRINPFIFGGSQERNLRAGTENVSGIIGFTRALELAMDNYQKDEAHISYLKKYMTELLKAGIENVEFNSSGQSLYSVLSVSFPKTTAAEDLLFHLDQNNICASGGSACSGGSSSHVMKALKRDERITVRFSFSRYNTIKEVEHVVKMIKNCIQGSTDIDQDFIKIEYQQNSQTLKTSL